MALSPTSSRGGFSGGAVPDATTFSSPVSVATTDANSVPLGVHASWNAQNTDFFAVFNTDTGIDFFAINSLGDIALVDRASGANRLTVKNATGQVYTTGGVATGVVTSGALPTVAPSSGTAFTCSAVRDVFLTVPVTTDASANDATCKVELSPDNVTYSTLGTFGPASALNVLGAEVFQAQAVVPAGWRVKLTVSHATLGTGTYY